MVEIFINAILWIVICNIEIFFSLFNEEWRINIYQRADYLVFSGAFMENFAFCCSRTD